MLDVATLSSMFQPEYFQVPIIGIVSCDDFVEVFVTHNVNCEMAWLWAWSLLMGLMHKIVRVISRDYRIAAICEHSDEFRAFHAAEEIQ